MKALILAAGAGTRLAPITKHYPKALVQVNGKPIIIKQIENLHENGITDITIISGYKSDILKQEIYRRWKEINVVESKDYAVTNNMFSAYLGRDMFYNEAFLMMNADVFFDESVITELFHCPYADAIVTDIGAYLEESMKVIEKDGRLVEISKTVRPEAALGASIDVYKFSAEGSRAFFDKCAEYIEIKGERKMWSEVALNDILGEIVFRACPLKGRWFEIDTYEDLSEAEELFRGEEKE